MKYPTSELELKLEIADEELRQIQGNPALRRLAISQPKTRLLRSIYFDTKDRRLQHASLSLRVRKVGRRWVQTVKCRTGATNGISNPWEFEVVVDGPRQAVDAVADVDLQRRLRKVIGKAQLMPLFETVVKRTTQLLRAPQGGEIELALDKGQVRCSSGTEEIREVELELKSGTPDMLLCVAETLFGSGPIQFSTDNKAERGYRLIDGASRQSLQPAYASAPRIVDGQDCAASMREIFKVSTGQILHNWRVAVESDDPVAIHQMRVGLRRVRSAIKLFRPVIDCETLRELDRNVRDLARLLGGLRDVDVLLADIILPLVASNSKVDLSSLCSLLGAVRGDRRKEVQSELSNGQWSVLQLQLAMLPINFTCGAGDAEREALRKPIKKLSKKTLGRLWRRIERYSARLDKLEVAERHELRKELKTLRYAIEFLVPIYGSRRTAAFIRQLKRLQEILGYLNDVAVAETLTLVIANGDAGNADVECSIGFVIGWHTARAEDAWLRASAAWKKLERSPRFWE